MTQRFILDENVVINAQMGRNEYGDEDSTCAHLVQSIIDICHTIVFDLNLWDKYYSQLLSLPRTESQGLPSLLRTLIAASQREGKLDRKENAPEFPEERTIPQGSQDDVVPVVRLAVQTGATLVTTDNKLRDDLNSCGVQEQYGLDVLSPADALNRL